MVGAVAPERVSSGRVLGRVVGGLGSRSLLRELPRTDGSTHARTCLQLYHKITRGFQVLAVSSLLSLSQGLEGQVLPGMLHSSHRLRLVSKRRRQMSYCYFQVGGVRWGRVGRVSGVVSGAVGGC